MNGLKSMEKYLKCNNIFGSINSIAMTITGIKNGKEFKIYYSKQRNPKNRNRKQVIVEYAEQIYDPIDNRELSKIFK